MFHFIVFANGTADYSSGFNIHGDHQIYNYNLKHTPMISPLLLE